MDNGSEELSDRAERRAMPRAGTHRSTEFSADTPRSVIGRGVIVDISPNGVQIHTRTPETVGQSIEIEVFPKTEDKEGIRLRVRGRVRWRKALTNGEWAMGVRLAVHIAPPESTPPGPRIKDSREAQKLLGEVSLQLQNGKPSETLSLGLLDEFGPSGVDVEFQPVPEEKQERKKRRWGMLLWLLWGVLFILLLSALFTVLLYFLGIVPPSGGAGVSISPPLPTVEAEGEAAIIPSESNGTKTEGEAMEVPSSARVSETEGKAPGAPAVALNRAQASMRMGRIADSGKLFAAAAVNPRGNALEHFIARLGQAETEAIQGRIQTAITVVERARAEQQRLPEEWRNAAEHYAARLKQTNPEDSGPALLRDALLLEKEGASTADASLFRITVNTSSYTLTVHRDNVILGTFPVGLGMNHSTPEGDFVVANKIVNPDWYNHGKVVKAGEPANPLGSRWMGLGNKNGPTPYGIHPTAEPESIGKNKSRGCIRMRAQDAEQVFAWCAIGTPVHIVP